MRSCDLIVVAIEATPDSYQSLISRGKTREALLDENLPHLVSIGERLSGFNGQLIVTTNPVELCTYILWLASGLPAEKFAGYPNIDSVRFRDIAKDYFLKHYSITIEEGAEINKKGMVVVQHSENCVPLFSSLSFNSFVPSFNEDARKEIKKQLIGSPYEYVKYVGTTAPQVFRDLSDIILGILRNDLDRQIVMSIFDDQWRIFIGYPTTTKEGKFVRVPYKFGLSYSYEVEEVRDSIRDLESRINNMRNKKIKGRDTLFGDWEKEKLALYEAVQQQSFTQAGDAIAQTPRPAQPIIYSVPPLQISQEISIFVYD
ncbi:hypothetical protein HZB88_00420, partial [archaeon]|nr:hypothetical protein [archaeon]